METKKVFLSEDEMPRQWYNILADIKMNPPLGPDGKPITPGPTGPRLPDEPDRAGGEHQALDRHPGGGAARSYPSGARRPLHRARALEAALKTPARIYYKNESVSPAGSHKPNTAVAQAYYNKVFGIKRLTTETGAGQWGSALAFACAQFGLECKVYMVRISFDQKPFRKIMMQTWGAECVPSPSTETKAGRDILAAAPRHPRQPRASPSARRSRPPSPTPPARPATPWAACSTTCCCTRPSSAWRPRSSWRRSASTRTS